MSDPLSQAMIWAPYLPYRLQIVLLVFIAAWTALLLHELGHALVARALGVRVWSITLGRGPVLFRGTLFGCHLTLALFPLHGEVRLHDADARALGYLDMNARDWSFQWNTGSSWRAPVISAAGSVTNLAAAGAVVLYWLFMPRLTADSFGLFAMCFVVNLAMYLNLAPIHGLDGWRLAVHAGAWRRQLADG